MNKLIEIYDSNHFTFLIAVIVGFVLYIISIKSKQRLHKSISRIKEDEEKNECESPNILKDKINLKSYVLFKDVLSDKVEVIKISEHQNKIINGVKCVNCKMPLAVALMNKEKGDIVKFKKEKTEKKHNYVEVLDISTFPIFTDNYEFFKEKKMVVTKPVENLGQVATRINNVLASDTKEGFDMNMESKKLINQPPKNNSDMLTIEKTRFYVDEKIYEQLKGIDKSDLCIIVNPNKGNHPRGTYTIPNNIILEFIKSKQHTYNWDNNKNFHQDSVPTSLNKYFKGSVSLTV